MEIKHEMIDDVLVIRLMTDRVDAENSEILKSQYRRLAAQAPKVAMDLQELEFLDSTGLGVIVFCLRFSQENGGLLKLANLSTKVRMIFEITRAYRVFDIFDRQVICRLNIAGETVCRRKVTRLR